LREGLREEFGSFANSNTDDIEMCKLRSFGGRILELNCLVSFKSGGALGMGRFYENKGVGYLLKQTFLKSWN